MLIFPLCSDAVDNVFPLDDAYVRPWELLPEIREIVGINPEIASWRIIGTSGTALRPIFAIKISDHVTLSEPYKPKLLFVGSHQSEEVIGIEVVLENARKTIEAYGVDPFLTEMIERYELWFVPTIDPEGFWLVNGGEYQFTRKNNTDTNWNGIFEPYEDGVDLNKNYPFNWDVGESDRVGSHYYKGTDPASEAEVQAMMAFCEEKRFAAAIFYHSSASGNYSERVFFPWRWENDLSPDYCGIRNLAQAVADELPRDFTPGYYTVHIWNNFRNGYARDYVYSKYQTWPLTIESGGNSSYGFGIIQPPDSLLSKHLRSHWRAYRAFLHHVDEHLLIIRLVDSQGEPYRGLSARIVERYHPQLEALQSNEGGYIFRLLEPGRYTLASGGETYPLVKREGATYREIVLSQKRKEISRKLFLTLHELGLDHYPERNDFLPETRRYRLDHLNHHDVFVFHPGMKLKLTAFPGRSVKKIRMKLLGDDTDTPLRMQVTIFADMRRVVDRIVIYEGKTMSFRLKKPMEIETLRVIIEQLDKKPYRMYKWQRRKNFRQDVFYSHWEELKGKGIGVRIDYD